MRDWEQMVRQRLGMRREASTLDDEVICEVAHHLEDVFERSREIGLSDKESANIAWNEVTSWPRLARKIHRAKGGTTMLKDRIQRLWLPGIVPAFLALGLLEGFATFGYRLRTEPWIPAYYARFYFGWLIALPLCGAVSAYWSRRAGGSLANRMSASLFLAEALLVTLLVLFAAQLVLLPLGLEEFHHTSVQWTRFAAELSRAGLTMVVLPAIMLFIGALPFLKERPTSQVRAGT